MSAAFRVLQFNMQFGQGWHESEPEQASVDLERTLAEIRRHDADIVLLQEVEQARPGGVQLQPPPNFSRLRAALADYDAFFAYPKEDPRELPFGIGLAIFSRTPLEAPLARELPSPPVEFEFGGEKKTPTDRLLIGATTAIHGRTLRIFNTHLLAFFMLGVTEEPPDQRRRVIEIVGDRGGPALVGGDFNAKNHQALIEDFVRAGFRPVQSEQPTWRRRPYVLDHIFYNRHLRLQRHAVMPTLASDHHALVADFEFAD